jgi:hypothetical protein
MSQGKKTIKFSTLEPTLCQIGKVCSLQLVPFITQGNKNGPVLLKTRSKPQEDLGQ